MSTVETIAAISTAPGRAGIGVVRISGPGARAIAKTITGKTPEPGRHLFTSFLAADGSLIDKGLVLYFQAPHSYTGEDVVELQAHGSDVVLQRLLDEICNNGARLAMAGEFTERAFLNNKIDLIQAEAVMDLIESTSSKAAPNRAIVDGATLILCAVIKPVITNAMTNSDCFNKRWSVIASASR